MRINGSRLRPFVLLFSSAFIPACEKSQAQEKDSHLSEGQKIIVTRPVAKDVVSTQQYVCQIHSRRHIQIRALETGYLEEVHIQEGQTVKRGEVMFRIVPVLYQASLDTEKAHAEAEQIKYDNTAVLSNKAIVSNQELALAKAELSRAKAKVKRAEAELNFTTLKAPFDGIVDRQREQQGSLVEEGDILSTLSDNEVMWVYFNVPEALYLQYKADKDRDNLEIQLKLANGEVFPYPGKIGAIEADFNNETGNIAFRADFANPDNLLRHGQTGTILIHRKLRDATVIPQRATYEILAKKYVYALEPGPAPSGKQSAEKHGDESVGGQGIVRQREIIIQEELDDIYVIKDGVTVNDQIIFEGIRQVRDGDKVEYALEPPEKILVNLKYHAE